MYVGINHEGCYNLKPGSLIYLERTHNLLMDSPYNRTNPITKCAQVANQNHYRHFAITLGLCYSAGSKPLSSYQTAGRSELCENGTGNYFGAFSVDVYSISDANTFDHSVEMINMCGGLYCQLNDTSVSCSAFSAAGSSLLMTHHHILLCLAISLVVTLLIMYYN